MNGYSLLMCSVILWLWEMNDALFITHIFFQHNAGGHVEKVSDAVSWLVGR